MNFWSAHWHSMTSAIQRRSFPMFPASWRKPKPSKLPLGLSPQQGREIQSLEVKPEWLAYRQALDEVYRLKGREILQGNLTLEQYHHGAGFLRAIELMATLPTTLTTVMTRVQTDADRRNTGPDDTDNRLLYGSPHWHGYSPDRVASPTGRPPGVGTR